MKLAEIVQKSEKEIAALVTEQQQALAEHIIELRTKKVANVKQIKAIKKIIARALTIQHQRELINQKEAGE